MHRIRYCTEKCDLCTSRDETPILYFKKFKPFENMEMKGASTMKTREVTERMLREGSLELLHVDVLVIWRKKVRDDFYFKMIHNSTISPCLRKLKPY